MIFAPEDDPVNIDEIRLRVEELSRGFGAHAPDVVRGEPPQGVDCILRRQGRNQVIVVGPTFDALPEYARDTDLAWAVTASDRAYLRKEGVPTRVSVGLGTLVGLVCAPLVFLFDSLVPVAVTALALLILVVLPVMMRRQIYAMDRRVAEVCGEESIHRALRYVQEHPPRTRGLYRLALKLQPSPERRAARLLAARP